MKNGIIEEEKIIVCNWFQPYEIAKSHGEANKKIIRILNYWEYIIDYLHCNKYYNNDDDLVKFEYLSNLVEKMGYPILIKQIYMLKFSKNVYKQNEDFCLYGFDVNTIIRKLLLQLQMDPNCIKGFSDTEYDITNFYSLLEQINRSDVSNVYLKDYSIKKLFIIRDLSHYFKDLEMAGYSWEDSNPSEINPYDIDSHNMEFDEE